MKIESKFQIGNRPSPLVSVYCVAWLRHDVSGFNFRCGSRIPTMAELEENTRASPFQCTPEKSHHDDAAKSFGNPPRHHYGTE
ncbi:hypothetical protein MRX96_031425 [Rhipicephalus microplus]